MTMYRSIWVITYYASSDDICECLRWQLGSDLWLINSPPVVATVHRSHRPTACYESLSAQRLSLSSSHSSSLHVTLIVSSYTAVCRIWIIIIILLPTKRNSTSAFYTSYLLDSPITMQELLYSFFTTSSQVTYSFALFFPLTFHLCVGNWINISRYYDQSVNYLFSNHRHVF